MRLRLRTSAGSRARRGMSLVEVIVALALLGSVMLGLEVFSARLAQSTYTARLKATATQLANDRIETVKGAPTYASIDSLYVGTEATIVGFPGYTRQTLSQHVGGGVADTIDYRIITVIVTYPKQTAPLRKTTVIAPF
ncbi:MAG TPA: prepilin-type N-terminal cleavage/methylation domain-containing protein [Gemmatimonadaceae bacterium]|nr:prepilin-type N-terminal cleavage/methylation domain-containing protein [Gemmatimonadaceae bacterium]